MKQNERTRDTLHDFVDGFIQGTEDLMIDVMAKRISNSKRQILYLFYILLRFLRIKDSTKPGEIGKVIYILSGRTSHNSIEGKKMIEFIYKVITLVNNDEVVGKVMKVVFVPNFSVTICEMFVAAADVSYTFQPLALSPRAHQT